MSDTLRLAVIPDYLEEAWPSMDLAAEMLQLEVRTRHSAKVWAELVRPSFHRRAGRLPLLGAGWVAHNADRLANRLWDYPRYLRRQCHEFDLFHIVDHSYAQLVHVLPAERTGVYCHDLDTFRCLLEPEREPRPRWFRAVARRILCGLQKAAIVFHNSLDTRRQIERHGLIDPQRLVHAPLGVSPEFTPDAGTLPATVLALGGAPFLLHVGSCIPRKRIDVLLDVFATVRRQIPDLRLVKVGADWSGEQRGQIDRLGLAGCIVSLSGLKRREIAALYRAAAVVLQPSEAEGFGLPVIEASPAAQLWSPATCRYCAKSPARRPSIVPWAMSRSGRTRSAGSLPTAAPPPTGRFGWPRRAASLGPITPVSSSMPTDACCNPWNTMKYSSLVFLFYLSICLVLSSGRLASAQTRVRNSRLRCCW